MKYFISLQIKTSENQIKGNSNSKSVEQSKIVEAGKLLVLDGDRV